MRVSAAEWREWILAGIGRLGTVVLPVERAHGRTLVEDVRSAHDLPLWDNSAMDGYALRAPDTAGATPQQPVGLVVTGEVLAGSAADPAVAPGTAVRIMTGAPVPSGADAVVPVELVSGPEADRLEAADTAHEAELWGRTEIRLDAPVRAGANIRRRGEDLSAGSPVARGGDALTAARLSALAAAGVAEVRVSEIPRVAVLVTGAELRPPGAPLARGQIAESNSLLVAGLLRESGIEPVAVRRCSDDADAVREQLRDLARDCDAIITTGGVGPGSHDVVRLAVRSEPGVRAARVAVRPGQPQCAGRLSSGAWLFALPGNPVSAATSFEVFVRPALLAWQGRADPLPRLIPAVAAVGWRGARGRLQLMPVTLEAGANAADDPGDPGAPGDDRDAAAAPALLCRPAVDPRGVSHAVGGHGAVQAYAVVDEDRGDVAAGDPVGLLMVGPR
ncbi:molybdopterin molybdotransferase MoeA [Leucobacter tenebrionis]|uniref:molybdopterin molybdotransferase MoeA n=1 Tax=Leucobacter tenebrionis TaxID=2873270 RepID=UPI001CA6898D|nr:gephyrin-like molybdotransferase Glp [Leucobacter tenebrionis]QZY52839.1 molybdopterin molybdotransferase MoeA [Leucobacter tenebrionis]